MTMSEHGGLKTKCAQLIIQYLKLYISTCVSSLKISKNHKNLIFSNCSQMDIHRFYTQPFNYDNIAVGHTNYTALVNINYKTVSSAAAFMAFK